MRIGLIAPTPQIPRFVLAVHQRIDGLYHAGTRCDVGLVTARRGDEAVARPPTLRLLLQLERMLAGGQRHWLIDDISDTAEVSRLRDLAPPAPPELLIDLVGTRPPAARGTRTLTPLLDGAHVEHGLWGALLAHRAPVIAISDSATGACIPLALPALEAPHRLLDSAEAVLTHLVHAITRAVGNVIAGKTIAPFASMPGPSAAPSNRPRAPLAFAADRIASKAKQRLAERLHRAPVWQTAWRCASQRTHPPRTLQPSQYHRLGDDGQRYYADPFVIEHKGVTHLFVEELPYATGRGILSHTILHADRPIATPVPILETAHHLSYPLVFEDGGQVWMLPECAASGRLDLYRADPFPSHWSFHATVVDAPLHDATIFRRGGRWWIMAGLAIDSASSWDTLLLYSADSLAGPWHAHPANPVLIDARSARPAGAVYEHDGMLWRPAQDCTGGYGSALSICRVDRLDDEGFSQSIAATLRFGGIDDNAGPHTLNLAGGFEVIDLFAPRPAPYARTLIRGDAWAAGRQNRLRCPPGLLL